MTDLTIDLYDDIPIRDVRRILKEINGINVNIVADADLYGRIYVSGVAPGDVRRVVDYIKSRNSTKINKIELDGVRV